jgi:hypothetical protein
MLKIRETKKSFIVENDGFNQYYKAYIQGNRVYKVIIPKKDLPKDVGNDWLEFMALDILAGYEYATFPKGCRVMYKHRID